MAAAKKVLVTGMGMVSALGLNLKENWANLIAGKSGVRKITRFDVSELETQIAAYVPDTFDEMIQRIITPEKLKLMTRPTMMAILSALEAVEKSQVDFGKIDMTRVAVVIGRMHTSYNDLDDDPGDPMLYEKSLPNAPNYWIAGIFGIKGPNFNISSACASSAYAIGTAFDLIRSNIADIVLVSGTDSHIYPERIKGFNQIFSLSVRNDDPQKASRPFTKNRDGFVMGEGAGMMLLESEKSAHARNAQILGEVLGYSTMSEAFNMVSPQVEGAGMAETMKKAILNSGISKAQVGYINAHGTSTFKNDRYETNAIKMVFKDLANKIPVSSSKSMIGHTIGAAGILEGIITLQSLIHNIIPPTINYDEPDPELDLDYVPNESREQNLDIALSNSFGFGGHNASVVFKSFT